MTFVWFLNESRYCDREYDVLQNDAVHIKGCFFIVRHFLQYTFTTTQTYSRFITYYNIVNFKLKLCAIPCSIVPLLWGPTNKSSAGQLSDPRYINDYYLLITDHFSFIRPTSWSLQWRHGGNDGTALQLAPLKIQFISKLSTTPNIFYIVPTNVD